MNICIRSVAGAQGGWAGLGWAKINAMLEFSIYTDLEINLSLSKASILFGSAVKADTQDDLFSVVMSKMK